MLILYGFLIVLGVASALLAYTRFAARMGATRERNRLARMALRNPAGFYLEVLRLQSDFLAGKLSRELERA